jgi:hypothetical protein
MLSTTPLRTLRTRACAGVTAKRFASHGAPHYNEPSGYVFGEKVRLLCSALSLPLEFALPRSHQPLGRNG